MCRIPLERMFAFFLRDRVASQQPDPSNDDVQRRSQLDEHRAPVGIIGFVAVTISADLLRAKNLQTSPISSRSDDAHRGN
jgi:hypothetical protein